jgi:hypothetical protein
MMKILIIKKKNYYSQSNDAVSTRREGRAVKS